MTMLHLLLAYVLIYAMPTEWEVLGPFPHGTKEAGIDPLSLMGGFENLAFNTDVKYPSELAKGGYVTWKKISSTSDGILGPIMYENVDWNQGLHQFGWASVQHATYLRGSFEVDEDAIFLVRINGVSTFKIDSTSYPGNLYNFEHAVDSRVFLEKGAHTLYVCLSYDIRVHGTEIPPRLSFKGIMKKVVESENAGIISYPSDIILPEGYKGRMLSLKASLVLKNTNKFTPVSRRKMGIGMGWKQVLGVILEGKNGEEVPCSITTRFTIYIAPGQIVAVPIRLENEEYNTLDIKISVDILDLDTEKVSRINIGEFKMYERTDIDSEFKITFEGFDHTIQYAFAKPPKKGCNEYSRKKCPVIIALHNTNYYATSKDWLDSVNGQDYAWVLFPSGRTKWGYDWTGPSFKNIDSSLEALHSLPFSNQGSKSDGERLIIVGHQNGAFGALWFASHYPDRVIAESSIAENSIDLYASNLANIPIFVRAGSEDSTVPLLHSRRLVRLIRDWSGQSRSTTFLEDIGKGHWFPDMLKDDQVQNFLAPRIDPKSNADLALPELPNPFTISTMNPASSGSRCGLVILQLEVPFRLASITVTQIGSHWKLTTTNVRRFAFTYDERQAGLRTWSVDKTGFVTPPVLGSPSYLNVGNLTWQLSDDLLWISRERSPTTYGPISQVFSEPFRIVIPSAPNANLTMYYEIAELISTSWYTYGKGSTQLIRDIDLYDGISAKYNLIVLGDPRYNYYTFKRTTSGSSKLFSFGDDGTMFIANKTYGEPGTGALFLAPSVARTRICLFVTGVDSEGLKRATWTIPYVVGMQVADYVVLGDSYGDPVWGWTATSGKRSEGAGGILATGFWSNEWDFDPLSGYLK